MSLIFFLLFMLSSTVSVCSINKHDEIALLKMKKQLGNPDTLHSWLKGFNFCDAFTGNISDDWVAVGCNSYTGRVTNLQIVHLHVVAPFPRAICDLTELSDLGVLEIPGMYGRIPSCITKLSNLTTIGIYHTSISGPVPDFHNNAKLTAIGLSHNHLSGTIPPSLSALPKLQFLYLQFNHLTGTIPPGLVNVTYSTLMLSNNNLTGELPKSYGWVDFGTFDVGNNRLRGDASFLFGKQKHTDILSLTNNNFKFDLSYIEPPYKIYLLDLSHNNIYGKVPDSLANHAFGVFNLSFNRLCGELPQGGYMWRYKAEDFTNNKCLCGSPLPPCSNYAPPPAAAPIYTPPF